MHSILLYWWIYLQWFCIWTQYFLCPVRISILNTFFILKMKIQTKVKMTM